MFKRLALATALLAGTLGVTFAPAAAAANRSDWGRNGRDRAARERVEHRENGRRGRDRSEVRDRDGYRGDRYYTNGYYTQGYYDSYGNWVPACVRR